MKNNTSFIGGHSPQTPPALLVFLFEIPFWIWGVECKGLIISGKGVFNGDVKETVERFKELILKPLHSTGILRGHTETEESAGEEWGRWGNS